MNSNIDRFDNLPEEQRLLMSVIGRTFLIIHSDDVSEDAHDALCPFLKRAAIRLTEIYRCDLVVEDLIDAAYDAMRREWINELGYDPERALKRAEYTKMAESKKGDDEKEAVKWLAQDKLRYKLDNLPQELADQIRAYLRESTEETDELMDVEFIDGGIALKFFRSSEEDDQELDVSVFEPFVGELDFHDEEDES